MSALKKIKNAVSSVANPANWLLEWIGGSKTTAGVRINGYTALTISTVWQAINVISGDVGQLPLSRYQRKSDTQRVRQRDPLMELKPNLNMTPLKFKETLQAHSLIYGNGYGLINRTSNAGTPTEVLVLDPRHVKPFFNNDNQLMYKSVLETNNVMLDEVYKPDEILHIRGLGFDGLQGYSVVSLAADCFGMAKAAEGHGASYFKNFATPQGLLKTPGGRPKQTVIDQTREDWATMQTGDNRGKVAMLYGGTEFIPLAFTNKDSQFLESREFQRTEIASWFNLPPHKVGDLSRATFANIEEQNRSYLTNSLMYWLVNWQEECTDKLLTQREKDKGFYYEFNTAALLRGDTKSRFEAYGQARTDGWLNGNEIRAMENLDPVDGLDTYLVPLNMTAVGQEPVDTTSTTDETSAIVKAAVTGLVRMEGNRVVRTSETAKNFNESVEKFYGQFSAKLWEVIEPMGATSETLDLYIDESKQIWSELSATCTQKELHSVVMEFNESWLKRADKLTELIIKDRNDG